MRHIACMMLAMLVLAAAYPGERAAAQGKAELIHQRGRIWENVANDGWIGSLGAWDYLVSAPLGLFPGFTGFQHPLGNENNAINTFANANMHDFRSGVWIVAKDMNRPGPPPIYAPTPTAYELYTSGLQEGAYGVEQTRAPLEMKQNFIENPGFDPLLPEELITATWNTSVGVTVTRRSYTWSYPAFRDFIIYDYVFKNTLLSLEEFWKYDLVEGFSLPAAQKGVEPYASWLKAPRGTMITRYREPSEISVLVVGGKTNHFWQYGDYHLIGSFAVDEWK